jgi:hypothetical protein
MGTWLPLLSIDSIRCQLRDFVAARKESGKRVYFTILAGTEGSLRGVPVQIRYRPDCWFQVVLNLAPGNPVAKNPALALR